MRPDPVLPDDARLYRAVFERSLGISFVLSVRGELERANATALTLAGRSLDTLVGKRLDEMPWWPGAEEERQRLREAVERAITGESVFVDTVLHAADGRDLDVDLSCQPIHDVGGAIVGVLVEARDVTRRVRSENALRASQAIFAGILNIAVDAIISIDEQQQIMHFNHGAEQIFGYDAAEALGMPLDLLLPVRFRGTHASFVALFGKSGEQARRMGHRREIFGLRKNGEEFPAEASISKLDAPEQRLYTVVLRDITERRRVEQNQRFLATAGGVLTRSLDTEQIITTVLQLAVDEFADGCVLDLVDDQRRLSRRVSEGPNARLNDRMLQIASRYPLTWDSPSRVIDVLRTGEPELVSDVSDSWLEAHVESAGELALVRDTGIRSLIIAPLVARETVIGTMSLMGVGTRRPYDAVDLQVARELALRVAFALENARLYADAQLATRARDEVLGVVSHDLRNPLSAIAMCTNSLLSQMPEDNGPQRELLGTVYQSTQWMNRLIQDLLDVSNIEAGRLSVERRAEHVEPILRRATAMFERQAAERSIALRLIVRDPVPAAYVDAERIVQVLTNLIGNAMKFTDSGGAITVEASAQGSDVVIAVSDTGSGIPPEHLPHVFERYWQARRTARKRGSGLGLAISRGIVEAHGGRIEVTSTLGAGSTFRFTVPAATDSLTRA